MLFIELAIVDKYSLGALVVGLFISPILVPRLFSQLFPLAITSKAEGKRLPRVIEENGELPRVDVFIPCCGEDIDIVLDTAEAACVLDYPRSLFRVIILVDSASTQLAETITQSRNKRFSNLYYAARNVQVVTHSKAANLNFGLQYANDLQGGKAELVSVLDVDMIPEPQWLRIVVSYVLNNPQAALACPFQRSYNIMPSDPLGMTYDTKAIEAFINLQDFANNSFCPGSGFVVRHSALDQIKGFPEESLSEDVLTSLILCACGWQTVYVPEPVQWGLAANTFCGWLKQRQRWAAGIISIAQLLCSPRAHGLPLAARFSGALWGIVDSSASFIWTSSMISLPLLILTGEPLLPYDHLCLLFRMVVLDFCAQSTCQALLCSLLDFRMSMIGANAAIWTAPYRLAIAVRFYIYPKLLGRPLPRFKPTGIPVSSGRSENEARRRGDSCLKVVLWDCGAWIHLLCFVACVAGLASSITAALRDSSNSASASFQSILQALVVRIAWPPVLFLWMMFAKNTSVTLVYAISPPAFVEREELLDRWEDTGVVYPK